MNKDIKVYKYRGSNDKEIFERDLYSLENNYFWAPTKDELNDPCEGLFERKNVDNQFELIEKIFTKKELLTGVKDAFEKILDFSNTSGIYSLSTEPLDELLWAHYGNSHKGFCIEYSLNTLIDFSKMENHNIPVKYQNKPPKLNVTDIVNQNSPHRIISKLLGTKSKKWKYEKEIRIVTSQSGKHDYDFRAVTAIYFGLRISEEQEVEIMRRLAGRNIKYYKIVLNNNYKFLREEIKNRFPHVEKYKYNIGTIAVHAISPELVHEKYKSLTDYLYKAAEIVRREPYCDLIEMVEFSFTKSTPDNPIIFVQYRREGQYKNHYFSISEIDKQYSKIIDLE
jgi:hypothetical protein